MNAVPAHIKDALRELEAERISYGELIDLQGFVEAQRDEPCIICGSPIDSGGYGHDEGCMGFSE